MMLNNLGCGDVLGIWKVLFDRFFYLTPDKIRQLQNEWNTISMTELKLTLDKYVSYIYTKAGTMKRYGIAISEEEMVQTFVFGLSSDFDWFRHHRRMNGLIQPARKMTA